MKFVHHHLKGVDPLLLKHKIDSSLTVAYAMYKQLPTTWPAGALPEGEYFCAHLDAHVDESFGCWFGGRQGLRAQAHEHAGDRDVQVTGWKSSVLELQGDSQDGPLPPSNVHRYRKECFRCTPPFLYPALLKFAPRGFRLEEGFRNEELQTLTEYRPGLRYVVDTRTVTDAPYSDCLILHTRAQLFAVGPASSCLLLEFHMQWVKPPSWFMPTSLVELPVREAVVKLFNDHFLPVAKNAYPSLELITREGALALADAYTQQLAAPRAAAPGAAAPGASPAAAEALTPAPVVQAAAGDGVALATQASRWLRAAAHQALVALVTLLIYSLALQLHRGRARAAPGTALAVAHRPAVGVCSASLLGALLSAASSVLALFWPFFRQHAAIVAALLLLLLLYDAIGKLVTWFANQCEQRRVRKESQAMRQRWAEQCCRQDQSGDDPLHEKQDRDHHQQQQEQQEGPAAVGPANLYVAPPPQPLPTPPPAPTAPLHEAALQPLLQKARPWQWIKRRRERREQQPLEQQRQRQQQQPIGSSMGPISPSPASPSPSSTAHAPSAFADSSPTSLSLSGSMPEPSEASSSSSSAGSQGLLQRSSAKRYTGLDVHLIAYKARRATDPGASTERL